MNHRQDLDVLRGLAVIAVIGFHSGLPWNGPGGVTAFFTLSGFLITSILLSARPNLRSFYQKRVRRLQPAAIVVILATLVWGIATGMASGMQDQALSSLFLVGNWERYFSHAVYGSDGFSAFSHFWSLAIEEQFYLVFPPLVALLWNKQTALKAMTAVAFVASFAFSVYSGSYYHTGARVWEILAGCLAAMFVSIGERPAKGLRSALLWAPLVVLLFFSPTVHAGAVVAATVMLCWTPSPAVPILRPLEYVGKISYGLYLWHILAQQMFSTVSAQLLFLAVATLVSYYLLEQPMRFRLSWNKVLIFVLSMTSFTVVVACQPATAPPPPPPVTPEEVAPVVAPTATLPVEAEPLRITSIGDSTMWALSPALRAWADANPSVEWVSAPARWQSVTGLAGDGNGLERAGCGLLHDVPWRWQERTMVLNTDLGNRGPAETFKTCNWQDWVPQALADMDVDVIVASYGPTSWWEHYYLDRWQTIKDRQLADLLRSRMDQIEEMGIKVVWVAYPQVSVVPTALTKPTGYVAWHDSAIVRANQGIMAERECFADLTGMSGSLFFDTSHFTPSAAAEATALISSQVLNC